MAAPLISTSRSYTGSTTHHRRTSSKIRPAQSAAPVFSSRFANVDPEEDVRVKDRRAGFAGNETFRSGNSMASSPTLERLGPILEDVPKSKPDPPARSTPTAIRTSPVRHRISPSLPYGPYEGKTAGPSGAGTPSLSSLRGQTPRQIALALLRRVRYLDLLYLIVFGGCVVTFLGALGGVGYSGQVMLPLKTPEPIAMPMIRPSTIMPQRPGQAPLVIKEDPEELAREEAERPVFARGRAPTIIAQPVPQQRPEVEETAAPVAIHDYAVPPVKHGVMAGPAKHAAVAPPVLRRPQPPIAPVVEERTVQHEPDDHAPDLVLDSPDDKHLDDAHAAHYHHPPEANVFHAHARPRGNSDDIHDEHDAEELHAEPVVAGHRIVGTPVQREAAAAEPDITEDALLLPRDELSAKDRRKVAEGAEDLEPEHTFIGTEEDDSGLIVQEEDLP